MEYKSRCEDFKVHLRSKWKFYSETLKYLTSWLFRNTLNFFEQFSLYNWLVFELIPEHILIMGTKGYYVGRGVASNFSNKVWPLKGDGCVTYLKRIQVSIARGSGHLFGYTIICWYSLCQYVSFVWLGTTKNHPILTSIPTFDLSKSRHLFIKFFKKYAWINTRASWLSFYLWILHFRMKKDQIKKSTDEHFKEILLKQLPTVYILIFNLVSIPHSDASLPFFIFYYIITSP